MAKIKTVQEEIIPYKEKVLKANDEIHQLIIVDQAGYELAVELGNRLNTTKKVLKDKLDSITAPSKQAIENAKAVFEPEIKKVEGMIATIKNRSLEWLQTERARAEEEKAKIEKKAEEGKLRPETALRKLGEVKEVENTTRTESGKMTMKKRKVYKIINPELLPREYLIPDEQKVKNALKAGIEVPGAAIEEVEEMSF
jgi:hypothetical protein